MLTIITAFLLHISLVMAEQSSKVFKIGLDEMDSMISNNELGQLEYVLSTEGTLAVTNLPQDYTSAVQRLKDKAPECLAEVGLPQLQLPDGSYRTTFATSSDNEVEYPGCVRDESEVISQTFDRVYAVIARLFTKVAGVQNLEWKTTMEDEPRNLSSLLQKEHIHVYKPSVDKIDQDDASPDGMVPFHYDNGMLLMITSFKEHPLKLRNRMNEVVSTDDVEDHGMLVLVARGLTEWLLKGTSSSSKFYAVPHAVPSLASGIPSRTVFARMKVVPTNALPCRMMAAKTSYRLFEDFFNDVSPTNALELCPMMSPRLRQEAWSQLKGVECGMGEAYCWMNCLALPESCPVDWAICTNSQEQPCCTELDNTGHCVDMDSTCHWQCGIPRMGPEPNVSSDAFCNGFGTDMHMNGFQATGKTRNPCVILFFGSWILDTRLKFFFACVGVIIFGILIEYLLYARRQLQGKKVLIRLRNPMRKVVIILLFGFNIGLGYLAMLVAMTYSIELFLCIVLGLVIGHALFNSSAPVGESVDPCCASQETSPPNDANYNIHF